MTYNRTPVLGQLLVAEPCRLVCSAQAELDKRARDLFADVVPCVLAVLTEVESLPSMADIFPVRSEGIENDNV